MTELLDVAGVEDVIVDVPVERLGSTDSDDAAPAPAPEQESASVPTVGAPAAWANGYTGQGILVAIIDNGVDYTHPDLGGCIGQGCKVVGGYDFIDKDNDPNEGYTDGARDYHGTHVAATAAGLKGVAPGANILAVRVLGTGQKGSLSTVMAGIDYAVRHGADVANMSLGMKSTYAPAVNFWTQMVSNAVKAGVVMVNSNGNNGPGTYTTNVYASGPDVIATGNSDARGLPFPKTTLGNGEVLAGGSYSVEFPEEMLGVAYDVVNVGYGNSSADYAGKDASGKIVIAERGGPGGAAFVNKANQAIESGAAGIIIYNDAARTTDFSAWFSGIPGFTMSNANGRKVLANPRITVTNMDPGVQMSSSSSRGPTPDLEIKPDVSAPGTGIVAAVPYEASPTGYMALSGTSMAAPHTAGAAALLLQAHPEWTPIQVKLAITNTASNLTDLSGNWYRTVDQGAGFLAVDRALAPQMRINPGSISFGAITADQGYTQTRTLSVEALGGGTYAVSTRLLKHRPGVSVAADTGALSGSGEVKLTVGVRPDVTPEGEYEGYLIFTNRSDPADTYRVPFLFTYQAPVHLVKTSSLFLGAGTHGIMDVTFTVGRPLANWYLGTMAGTRFTNHMGAAQPGTVTCKWNGRTRRGSLLTEGGWNIGVWYQLRGSTTWNFGLSYVRFYVDRTAPVIALDETPATFTGERTVTVRGAVSDAGMNAYGKVGGNVTVNGEPVDLFHRAPAERFPGQDAELAFAHTVTLQEGQNSVVVTAEDAAGNRSSKLLTAPDK